MDILPENDLNIKSRIAEIVGLKNNDNWKVFHSKPEAGLYLIHYTENANMYEYGHIRGIIIDINDKKIVCDAYKYTPIVKSNKIEFDATGKLVLHDELGRTHVSYKNRIRIVPGFEVVTVRVFLHKGKVYYSTYKKIEVWESDSHWGDSQSFDQMCIDLNIPSQDVLFPDKTKINSNFAYIFMLVHPGILNVSKIDAKAGFIVYGGAKKIWDLPPNQENLNSEIMNTPVDLNPTSDLDQAIQTTGLYAPPSFTVEQAEAFLNHGYYSNKYKQSDSRLDNGEFVIIYLNNTADPYSNVVRVESSSYRWRSVLKDNKPNLKNQLWRLLDHRKSRLFDETEFIDYKSKFPSFSKFTIESIVKKLEKTYIHFWPSGTLPINKYATIDDIIYDILVTFIMIVPLHRQKDVVEMYYEYNKNKKEVVEYLFDLSNQDAPSLCEDVDPDKRILKLIELSKGRALQNLNRNGVQLIESKDTQAIFKEHVRGNLEFLIGNEMGKSLYKIYKKMNSPIKVSEGTDGIDGTDGTEVNTPIKVTEGTDGTEVTEVPEGTDGTAMIESI
ncbi:MAG: hypothetical protein EHM34_08150 [Nitrosopumilales archaeon]|nr:MAG: hypothetical protein EHM34_08150 [Nitrosopumilales archaeon]